MRYSVKENWVKDNTKGCILWVRPNGKLRKASMPISGISEEGNSKQHKNESLSKFKERRKLSLSKRKSVNADRSKRFR